MKKILLAGATGYLGSHIAKKLLRDAHDPRLVVRSPKKLEQFSIEPEDLFHADVTRPETLKGCCKGIDTVISTIGITRQKDGRTYMDVDYQANLNLLNEARDNGVRKFVYVSVLNGEKLRHLKMCDAKERFVEQLRDSGLEYCVIRPNAFFSDMSEFFHMAQKGSIYIFGNGEQKTNPIHGDDLAEVCISAVDRLDHEIRVGGPETLSYKEIANIAFEIAGSEPNIRRIPDWMRIAMLGLIRTFTSSKFYGPLEFFLTVTAIDMIAPEYGVHRLRDHFSTLRQQCT